MPYRGRFAPSPTGLLHLGSLVTAVASYLEARSHKGEWILRIENIDSSREIKGSGDTIQRTLEEHGFCWDGEVNWQSQHLEYYELTIAQLFQNGSAYTCDCPRSNLIPGLSGERNYPGTCREKKLEIKPNRSIRILTHDHLIQFTDRLQGQQSERLESTIGDFIIKRADGYPSYQIAVVLDDARQKITEVIRGIDLITSTPRQIHLQSCLGLATPRYAHIPIVTQQWGSKLSKSEGSGALNPIHPGTNLWMALTLLRQEPPPDLREAPVKIVWQWSDENWSLDRLRGIQRTPLPERC